MADRTPHRTEIDEGREEIRIRWRLFWFLTAGMLLVFLIFTGWAIWEGQLEKMWRTYVMALAGSVVVVNIAWGRVVFSRCPRCGNRFYSRDWWPVLPSRQLFGGRCVHCKLRLRGRHDDDDSPGY